MFDSLFGKDIYWYGVQAISLLESGELHSPDRSPIFHIVALVFRFLGTTDESLFVFQLLTVIWLLFCLYFARFIQKSSHESWNLLPSVMVFVLGFLYPKQAWAVGFLLLTYGLFLSDRYKWKHSKWLIVAVLLLLTTWFHAMVGILGLGLWCLYKIPRKFDLLIFLILIILPFLVPKDDNDRFVIDGATFPIFAAYGMMGLGILWDWCILIFGKNVMERQLPIRRSLAFVGMALVLPIFHFADIQFRILISFLLVAEIFSNFNSKQILITFVSFGLWVFVLVQSPNLFRYPYEVMWLPGEKAATVSNNGLLVAHHGFCEYYHFQFRKDCMSWEPDEKAISELPKGTRVYRLVYGIRMENLRASKENGNPIFSTIEPMGEYQLVLEYEWQSYRKWLEAKNSKLLSIAKSWKNPYRKRPGFIQRKQKYGI
ncbi:hypothetical protein EHQ46_01455 [Leptospira yanagawae]|uniref:Glycosyltransferase RgtA/B/C/D-like domain-containing protein n=1 Tax=Leptospira yanagawae TaxID=293069 RepID=A0ABY2M3S3_9LEPT|nr:hypothetical protein [Leptospira yanagawae]TGL23824.1 hypothetical protein EHQ46_01455 [Leptospira yanagawae]